MILASVLGCSEGSTNSAAAQRSVTEYTMADGTELSALSGAIRAEGDSVVARFVAPQGRFAITTTAESVGEKSFLIDNLAPTGTFDLALVQVVTNEEIEGCGTVPALLFCFQAQAAVGGACPAEGCPTGTLCDGSVCTATNALNRCESTLSDVESNPTRKVLTLSPDPCTRSYFLVEPPPVETVRFAVIGSGSYIEILERLRPDVDAGSVDFVLFLGDNLAGAEAENVAEMSTVAREYPVPIIALPGEVEISVEDSPRFVSRFGPGEFAFQYGPLRGFAFTSAGRHLGTRGLDRIRALIRQVRANDEPGDDFPVMAFTHVPPVDPNGARDFGFVNEIEAARTMSILNEQGVEALIAGHVSGGEATMQGGLEIITTVGEAPLVGGGGEILWVTVGPASEVDGRVVGDYAYQIEREPR